METPEGGESWNVGHRSDCCTEESCHHAPSVGLEILGLSFPGALFGHSSGRYYQAIELLSAGSVLVLASGGVVGHSVVYDSTVPLEAVGHYISVSLGSVARSTRAGATTPATFLPTLLHCGLAGHTQSGIVHALGSIPIWRSTPGAKWRPHWVGCEEVQLLKSDGHGLKRHSELIGKRVEGVSVETVGSGEFAGSHPHRLPPWRNIPYVCSEERESRSVVQFERTRMEPLPKRRANIVFRHAEMGRKRVGLLLKVRPALVVPAAIQWWIAMEFRHVRVHYEVARFVG